jgi:hypothetical protein
VAVDDEEAENYFLKRFYNTTSLNERGNHSKMKI